MAIQANSTPAPAAPPFPYPWPRGMRAPTRHEAETMVQGLIDYLDGLDGDADCEPSLGSIDATTHGDFANQETWAAGLGFDREAGDDNGIADADGMDWVTLRAA